MIMIHTSDPATSQDRAWVSGDYGIIPRIQHVSLILALGIKTIDHPETHSKILGAEAV